MIKSKRYTTVRIAFEPNKKPKEMSIQVPYELILRQFI